MKNVRQILIAILLLSPISIFALANPASVYCKEHGGMLELNQDRGDGICKFNDGTECEEWAYMDGKCVKGQYKDWVALQPKDPDFAFAIVRQGWVTNNSGTPNYVDEKDSMYNYYQLSIQNINKFSLISQPTQLTVYNGNITQTYSIPPLGPMERSESFDFFIPIKQKIHMEINADRSVKELDYDNNVIPRSRVNKELPVKEAGTTAEENIISPEEEPENVYNQKIPTSQTKNNNLPITIGICAFMLLGIILYVIQKRNRGILEK